MWVWVFSELRTGEPVKHKLFGAVIGCDISDHVTHGSHNTNDPRTTVIY